MDNLTKEQLLLLQQNLTYEVYEQFMGMFDSYKEYLPEGINERNKYILDTMKNHEYWGKIHGWGENRFYCHLPKRKSILMKDNGPHNIYSMFKGNTRKELLNFLEEFKKYTPETYIPSECMEVEKEEKLEEDYESSNIRYQQMSAMNEWIDDSVDIVKLERYEAVDFHQ